MAIKITESFVERNPDTGNATITGDATLTFECEYYA